MRRIGNEWGKDTIKLFVGLFSLMFFFAAYTKLALMGANALASVGKTLGAGLQVPQSAASLKIASAQNIPAAAVVKPVAGLRGPGITG